MLSRLYNLLSTVSIATLLAGGGFSAFLFGTGRLNAARLERIAAVVRGELDEFPQSQPATQPAESDEPPVGRDQSLERIDAARRQRRLQSHLLERAARDIEAQRRLLDQSLQYLVNEREQLAAQQADWAAEEQKVTGEVVNEAAQKHLELFAGLAPQQAKEHLVWLWSTNKAEALALVMQLEVATTKRILAQMKAPEEQKILSELLEQLRTYEASGAATMSRKTAGDAAP